MPSSMLPRTLGPRRHLSAPLCIIAALTLATVLGLATETPALPPELGALNEQFIKLQVERVTVPFEADLAKLNIGYLGALNQKIAEQKAAGRLDDVLALEEERKLIETKQPLPQADEKTPASLKATRILYQDAFAKLEARRTASQKALTGPLDKRLAQMEVELTKADRVTDAKAVRAYRQALSDRSLATQPATELALKNGLINTLGMKFVPVPGTEVLFCIHETRYKDYAAYAADVPGVDASWKNQSVDGFTVAERNEDHALMKVSWEDAQAFCAWLSKKEGKSYRLPTDKEWSHAVGIGREEKWKEDTTPATVFKPENEFPWGDKWPPPKGAGNYSDQSRQEKAPSSTAQYLEGFDDGYPTTAPVMSFKPNKFGLYDLGGNVFEWVEDWYDSTKIERVLRGGSWFHFGSGGLLSSNRGHHPPGARDFNCGFRVVLVVGSGK